MFRNHSQFRQNPRPFLNATAGVILPLFQAVITGLIVGVLAGSLAWVIGWDRPTAWGVVIGALAAVLSWFAALRHWWAALGVDTSGKIPSKKETTVRVELSHDNGRVLELANLPTTDEQLQALAIGLVNGASFTEAAWLGTFTRAEWVKLRDAMINRGLAAWTNPTCPARGAVVTKPGWAVMRYLANGAEIDPPTPEDTQEVNIRNYR